jgi:uncharacterized protein YbjT (DUF2867 family)
MRLNSMFLARVRPIAGYRVEGEEDGAGKHPREAEDAGSWGHGQDWPPRGGEARGTRPAGANWLSDTWATALEGVSAAYVSYYPDLAIPGAPEAVRSFTELAVESGVQRLVLLSGRGEEEAQSAEQAVREVGEEAGVEWTIVRCAWFMQNFDENFLLEPILAGEVALPSGNVPEPFVDADDIADVAVAALTEDGHAGEIYELTGPRLLTMEEAVGEISRATGRQIRFVPVTLDEFVGAAYGDVPPEFLSFLTYLFGEVLDGRNAHLTDGVRRALGREPKDFSDYARDVATTGVWSKAA